MQQHQISPSPVQAAQAFLANATSSDIDVFVNTMMQDWRVGGKLWSSLNHEMKSSIMDARREAMNADHRGGPNDRTQNGLHPKPSNRTKYEIKTNTDIMKSHQKCEISNQYSGNMMKQVSEDDSQTFVGFLGKTFVAPTECKAHTHYLNLFKQAKIHYVIADNNADSIIGGGTWLIFVDINGPCVRRANVVGYDEVDTKKFGLPLVPGVTKVSLRDGGFKYWVANHLISNSCSKHTLFSTFLLREMGLVVDDVSECLMKSQTEHGTSCITNQDGTIADLKTRGALPTFQLAKPTLEEWNNAKPEDVVVVSHETWDPRTYHHEKLATTPPVVNAFTIQLDQNIQNQESCTDNMSTPGNSQHLALKLDQNWNVPDSDSEDDLSDANLSEVIDAAAMMACSIENDAEDTFFECLSEEPEAFHHEVENFRRFNLNLAHQQR